MKIIDDNGFPPFFSFFIFFLVFENVELRFVWCCYWNEKGEFKKEATHKIISDSPACLPASQVTH